MTQRKKFLFAGLGLNLLFYTAISIAFVSLSSKDTESVLNIQLGQLLQARELMLWDKQETARQFIKTMETNHWAAGHSGNVARTIGLVAVSKRLGHRTEKMLLEQRDEPVPDGIFDSKTQVAIFHTNGGKNYLTFMFPVGEIEGITVPYSATIEVPFIALPSPSNLLASDVTVLEQNGTDLRILRSTFEPSVSDSLKKNFEFSEAAPPANPTNLAERLPYRKTITLSNEKYLIYPIYFINQSNLKQTLIYSFRMKDFVTFDHFSAAVALILLLCISIGVMMIAYVWSHDEKSSD